MESVTFTPHYTLRATSTGSDSTLNIRYQARISNNSGEDWNEVSLAISTAQASETTVIPRLMRWTVDFRSPVHQYKNMKSVNRGGFGSNLLMNNSMPMMQQQQQQMVYASASRGGGAFGAQSYDAESATVADADLETAAAEVSEGITSTFIIPGKQTIKDGEKSHTVVIRDLALEGNFANICVPKVKDVAYLQVPGHS